MHACLDWGLLPSSISSTSKQYEQQNLLATAATRMPAAVDPSYRGTSNEDRIYDQALQGWMQAHPAMRRACGAAAASQAPWGVAQQQRRQQEQLHKQQLRQGQLSTSDPSASNTSSNSVRRDHEPRHQSKQSKAAPSSASTSTASTTVTTKETSKIDARRRAKLSAELERGRSGVASDGAGSAGVVGNYSSSRRGGGTTTDELLVLPLESSEQLEVQLEVLRSAMVRAKGLS